MQKTILIAEDEVDQLTLIEELLSELDCKILTAQDGAETLEKIKNNKVDLLILDLSLPIYSGFKIIENIENNSDTYGNPDILIYSNYSNDYIQKLSNCKLVKKILLKLETEPTRMLNIVTKLIND